MKNLNKHVGATREQIVNTLEILVSGGLTRITKDVLPITRDGFEILTWKNHVSGRHNAGKSFATLNQYVSIYESGAYHCILFDGSIIRACFKFKKNILIQESLLYWPAPFAIPEDEVDEFGIRDALDMYISNERSANSAILMRSPFRFDFDSTNISEYHPASHIHIQHADCRISARQPICFNTFVRFIFTNFYPDRCPAVINELDTMHYSGFSVCNDAIMCL